MARATRYLVSPFGKDLPVGTAYSRLKKAHDFLVRAARTWPRKTSKIPVSRWGQELKRTKVSLPRDGRTELVRYAANEQSFIELVNQCANLERLLDLLNWAKGHLPNAVVVVCHPTTSGGKKGESKENDLVLRVGKVTHCFEVSDTSGGTDGNKKEQRDLEALRVSDAVGRGSRHYLVVSPEFAGKVSGRKSGVTDKSGYRYEQRNEPGAGTAILEVIKITSRAKRN